MTEIDRRKLGTQGLEVPAMGLGCMGMSWAYGQADDAESVRTLHRSLELGMNFWDTAEIYGPFKNEELLGRALKAVSRDKVIVATKFGWEFGPNGERTKLNSSAAHIKKAVEGSLRRLGTDVIDLYYQHRFDPATPIEETVGAMADLVREGKIRFVGLSEVGVEVLRRANAVHPIAALQSEYSLWERSIESDILPALRELKIGLVAYSPMGRGFLTGSFQSADDFAKGDSRLNAPRFQGKNLEHNLTLVEMIKAFGATHMASPAQIAIAWVLRQGPKHGLGIVPIPGTKRVSYLEQNAAAAHLPINEAAWSKFENDLASFHAAGDRYAADMLKLIHR